MQDDEQYRLLQQLHPTLCGCGRQTNKVFSGGENCFGFFCVVGFGERTDRSVLMFKAIHKGVSKLSLTWRPYIPSLSDVL